MDIKNQVAVITGGASGLGKACAAYLKESGVIVVILDKNVNDSSSELEITCDVSDEFSVESAFKKIVDTISVPRICINCAGIAPAGRIVTKVGAMKLEEFKKAINVNLIGTFNVLKCAAEHMLKVEPLANGERGVIINTASIAAYEGQIGQSAYSASKGGIVALTLPAAREFANFGIRVNSIAPGIFETPLLLDMPKEVQKGLASTIPFPKRLGEPLEFAMLVEHVIKNPMINGETIRIDGALRMQPKPF